jgi:hypothetical protein
VGIAANRPSDAQGRFELGPLVEGRYTISIILSPLAPPGLSPGEPIEVQAGAEDVRVELRPGASLCGVLVDEGTRAPLEGDIVLSAATPQKGPRPAFQRHCRADRDGHFQVNGIPPGTYDLAATGGGLAVVVRGVEVQAGVQGPELTLSAQPGAKVAVRYEGGEPYVSYTVFADGTAVASNGLRRGSEEVHAVPPGPIRVVCTWKGLETPWVHELTLQVGERGEAVFVRDE